MDLPVERVLRPSSLSEALALLAEDPEARPLAGGTDLVVQLRDGRRRAATVLDLGALGLTGIRSRGRGLVIGAATTMVEIAGHPAVRRAAPALAVAAGQVGAWPIQCRATLGGNLANASPAADAVPPLLVAGASVEVASASAVRTLTVEELVTGPGTTALAPGELLLAVHLPAPPAGRVVERFVKLGPRREQVIAVVSLAGRARLTAAGRIAEVRLALGAVAPTPVRARAAEETLVGRRPDDEARRAALAALSADIAPIDDQRAPASYRRLAAAALLDRFLEELGD